MTKEIKRKCYEEACRIQTTTTWYLWADSMEDVDGVWYEYGICSNLDVNADLYAVKYAAELMAGK